MPIQHFSEIQTNRCNRYTGPYGDRPSLRPPPHLQFVLNRACILPLAIDGLSTAPFVTAPTDGSVVVASNSSTLFAVFVVSSQPFTLVGIWILSRFALNAISPFFQQPVHRHELFDNGVTAIGMSVVFIEFVSA